MTEKSRAIFFNEKKENVKKKRILRELVKKKRILRELHEKGSFKGLKERYRYLIL
jgi:hypothetical protein